MNTRAEEVHADRHSPLWEKIEGIKTGMLTLLAADGTMSSRPMTVQDIDDDGALWFFASDESLIGQGALSHSQAHVSLVDGDASLYVSISGAVAQVEDRARAAELWNPLAKAWFPAGIDDPHLLLLRFDVSAAHYWNSEKSKMMQLLLMAAAAVTGEQPHDIGEQGDLDLKAERD